MRGGGLAGVKREAGEVGICGKMIMMKLTCGRRPAAYGGYSCYSSKAVSASLHLLTYSITILLDLLRLCRRWHSVFYKG